MPLRGKPSEKRGFEADFSAKNRPFFHNKHPYFCLPFVGQTLEK
jgi:hypothetical protein